MLGLPILYFKGMRLMVFQLSGFYCKPIAHPHLRKIQRLFLHKGVFRNFVFSRLYGV